MSVLSQQFGRFSIGDWIVLSFFCRCKLVLCGFVVCGFDCRHLDFVSSMAAFRLLVCRRIRADFCALQTFSRMPGVAFCVIMRVCYMIAER